MSIIAAAIPTPVDCTGCGGAKSAVKPGVRNATNEVSHFMRVILCPPGDRVKGVKTAAWTDFFFPRGALFLARVE